MNKLFKLPANYSISLLVISLITIFAIFSAISFPVLSLERIKVADGEVWRLFTGNFVHFGWAHTLMNLAAFFLCAIAILNSLSIKQYVSLILFCCITVGVGVYYLNPEYETYAGLSGAIHGFIVAGLMLNKRHNAWINGVLVLLLFGKIFHEHQTHYQANDLQALLPVPVAYDAHLYGAVAGLVFGGIELGRQWFNNKQLQKN